MKIFVYTKNNLILISLTILITILVCVFSLSFKTISVSSNGIKLPILMYHQVSENQSKLGKYVISPTEFENDVTYIIKSGYTPINSQDLIDYVYKGTALPPKPIMITFDDGFESDYKYVYPILTKHNIKASFAITGIYADLYSTPGIDKHINYSHSSWEQIKEMYDSGLAEFQNHSYDLHKLDKRRGVLKTSSENQQTYEDVFIKDTQKNKDAFIKNVGFEPIGYVYPFGFASSYSEDILKKFGYKITFGVTEKPNYITGHPDELFSLNRYNRSHNYDIKKILD